MATWKNLDTLDSFGKLKELKNHVDIAAALSGEEGGKRVADYSTPMAAGLSYNYAAKEVDETVLSALAKLADEAQLIDKFQELYNGAVINTGENRMVLHHLARKQLGNPVVVDGVDKREFYVAQQKKAADFANKVHAGEITNEAGEKFTTVVQIGIGGSDLGPRALYIALENWAKANNTFKMEAKFISNVDPDDAAAVLASVDLAHSLFIVVSKSGTTLETLTNEAFVKDALTKAGLNPSKHMLAVTSETSPLAKSEDYLTAIFMDDYIGGRYSSVSGVGGAILSLAFGPEVFAQLLEGAAAEDQLATNRDLMKNPDMLDALIGIYERNVQGYPSTAVLPYSQALSRFPAHLQQCDMESNGKTVNRFGEPVNYVTGPVIFGEPGTNGQHSFYQLLHQGSDIVPLQFIGFKNSQLGVDVDIENSTSQQKLCANVAAQIVAFACGKEDENLNKNFKGKRPSSIIIGQQLTPASLGALLAHFENKIMFQGFVWNLNSFDQEGVQLGKVLAKRVLAHNTARFEKEFLGSVQWFLEKGEKALEMLVKSDYEKLRDKAGEEGLLCHGEYNQHNVLLCKNQAAVTNFDHFSFDMQISDLYCFMRKILEKYNWDVFLARRMLEQYDKIRPISSEEWENLQIRFTYPEKYWKLANYYFSHNKAWISGKNTEKLEKVIAQKKIWGDFPEKCFGKSPF